MVKRILAFLLCFITFSLSANVSASSDKKAEIILAQGMFLDLYLSGRMAEAIKVFEARNPEYQVRIVHFDGDNWVEQLIVSLMSGEDQIDILPSYNDMYYAYLNHGLLIDLLDYPGFQKNLDDYIYSADLLLTDGALYSVPDDFMEFPFNLNIPLMNAIGLERPDNDWTWKDFREYAYQTKELVEKSGFREVYLFADSKEYAPIFFWFYTSAYYNDMVKGNTKYDSDEFRQNLRLWKELADAELISLYSTLDEVDYSKVIIQDSNLAGTDGNFIVLPDYEKKGTPVEIINLGVCSLSKNKEKAAELLQIYSSKELIVGKIGTDFSLKDYSYPVDEEELLGYPSVDSIDNIRNILANGIRSYMPLSVYSRMHEIWPKYLAGEITEDAVIASLDEAFQQSLNG